MGQDNKKIDLSDALNNSDSNTNFQEKEQSSILLSSSETSKIVQLIIKYSGGHIKNEDHVNYVLLGFVALAITISLFLVFGGGNEKNTFTPPAEAPAAVVIPPAKF